MLRYEHICNSNILSTVTRDLFFSLFWDTQLQSLKENFIFTFINLECIAGVPISFGTLCQSLLVSVNILERILVNSGKIKTNPARGIIV